MMWRYKLNKYVSRLLYYFHPIKTKCKDMEILDDSDPLISMPEYDFNSVLVVILLSYVHHFDSLTW